MKTLLEYLDELKRLPMHMPGHKRNIKKFGYLKRLGGDIDITEIDGYDNLHEANGILKESMERAAKLRGADHAYYLVGGTTCGVLAAITAVCNKGDTVICARNCHKSVYNAMELAEVNAVYIMPKHEPNTGGYAETEPDSIESLILENPDAKLVVITSPTYEGIVSDVEKICKISHKYGIPVLVDAAHGAHLFGRNGFLKGATECGADISVESLHKTLPSLTQTAICWVSGDLVSYEKIAEKLAVFETSSPSYVLLASIDSCMELLSNSADEVFSKWAEGLDEFYKKAKGLKNLRVLTNEKGQFFALDRSKIVILSGGLSGAELQQRLRMLGIETEMASNNYVIAMTGAGDDKKSLNTLYKTLAEIDKTAGKQVNHQSLYPDLPEKVYTSAKAKEQEAELVDYGDADGRISAEYVWAYPPGIPILVPGERITKQVVDVLKNYEAHSTALYTRQNGKILVIKMQ